MAAGPLAQLCGIFILIIIIAALVLLVMLALGIGLLTYGIIKKKTGFIVAGSIMLSVVLILGLFASLIG